MRKKRYQVFVNYSQILTIWRILFLLASFGINKLFLFLFVQKLATWIYSYSYSREKLLFADHSSGQRLIPSIGKPKRIFFFFLFFFFPTIFGFFEKNVILLIFFLHFFSFQDWAKLASSGWIVYSYYFFSKKKYILKILDKKKDFLRVLDIFLIDIFDIFWVFGIFLVIFFYLFFFTFWNFRFFWNFGGNFRSFFWFFDSFQS